IALAADFSGSLQDRFLQHLPAADGLDCADETMATMGIAQAALAPLLLGCEHALHRAEFCDRVIIETVNSVERHSSHLRAAHVTSSAPEASRGAAFPDCLTRCLCCHSSQAGIFLRNAGKGKRNRV